VATVGIRELKNRLSELLHRASDGERITVTDRGRPVAVIGPPEASAEDEAVVRMVREGLARWEGGRPPATRRTYRIRGKPLSDTVIEGRR
jgi:prevent-host-death family protein